VIKTLRLAIEQQEDVMRLLRIGLSASFVVLVACTGQVNVGGPLEDSGAVSDSGSHPPTGDSSASMADSSASPGDASSNDPSTDLQQARAYASGNVQCNVPADCCVVFDGCANEGLVVGVADKDKVASLLASFDKYEFMLTTGSQCTGCIPPPTEVSCVQHKCTGTIVNFTSADAGDFSPWMMNHCGSIPNANLTATTGSILGC
jgi:hypothetical protein